MAEGRRIGLKHGKNQDESVKQGRLKVVKKKEKKRRGRERATIKQCEVGKRVFGCLGLA